MWFFLLPFSALAVQTLDLSKIRDLYSRAPLIKSDALQLNQLMIQVDTATASGVLACYKGANEMIQAKYTLNPMAKLDKFNKGKQLITKAVARDTFNLEVRFIRYTIQSNLPSFLGYHNNLSADKKFLQTNTKNNKDPELRQMIFNYLSASIVSKPD